MLRRGHYRINCRHSITSHTQNAFHSRICGGGSADQFAFATVSSFLLFSLFVITLLFCECSPDLSLDAEHSHRDSAPWTHSPTLKALHRQVVSLAAIVITVLTLQYGADQDDTTSLYSAAPSTTTIPPIGHGPHPQSSRAELGLAIEDLSLETSGQSNGTNGNGHGQGYEEDYDQVLDEMREPLGHNVEHACR